MKCPECNKKMKWCGETYRTLLGFCSLPGHDHLETKENSMTGLRFKEPDTRRKVFWNSGYAGDIRPDVNNGQWVFVPDRSLGGHFLSSEFFSGMAVELNRLNFHCRVQKEI